MLCARFCETGQRRRKRRRQRGGWGDNRNNPKLGGGEKLGRGELLAADEEELEELEKRERIEGSEEDGGELDGVGGLGGGTQQGLFEAGVDGEMARGGKDGGGLQTATEAMIEKEGGRGDAGLIVGEVQEAVQGMRVKDESFQTEMQEAVGVKQELELDSDAFSDDDLL